MTTIETKQWTRADVDRTKWGSGPWEGEPDKKQWQDEKTGLACLAVRNSFGCWCGYVGVLPGHPWHGKGYSEVDPAPDCHGGLTFAAACHDHGDDEARGICHIGPKDTWWFGFDCAHAGDKCPAYRMNIAREFLGDDAHGDRYRTLAYVESECAALAQQIAEVAT